MILGSGAVGSTNPSAVMWYSPDDETAITTLVRLIRDGTIDRGIDLFPVNLNRPERATGPEQPSRLARIIYEAEQRSGVPLVAEIVGRNSLVVRRWKG